jgi:hypothetical protein
MPDISNKQAILIKFLSISAKGKENPGLDPVRIMKGLFIFSQEIKKEWLPPDSLYQFVPYNFGPCSFEIYQDLRALTARRYIITHQELGQNWHQYFLTAEGKKFAGTIKIRKEVEAYLRTIKEFVLGISFATLLQAVYKEYPTYAENSIFKQ